MRNFDADRAERLARSPEELEFIIGGETFKLKTGVSPDVWARYWDGLAGTQGETNADQIRLIDDTMTAVLADDGPERWRRVRDSNGDLMITFPDLMDVIRHVWEVTTGRPTGAPSDSSERREPTTTRSTDASPSPE